MAQSAVFERIGRGSETKAPEHDEVATRQHRAAPLRVGSVHDHAESRADEIAERVLSRLAADVEQQDIDSSPTDIRRHTGGTASTGLAGIRAIRAAGGAAPDAVADAIDQSRGQPLDSAVRRRMEPAFGSSLAAVRVHHDASAAAISATLSADAFTVGKDIFFGGGQYRPGTRSGDQVLAHELAHTFETGPARRSVIHRKLAGTAAAMENMGGGRTSGKTRKLFGKLTNWDRILSGLTSYEDMETRLQTAPATFGQWRPRLVKTLRGVSSAVTSWRDDNKSTETKEQMARVRRGNLQEGEPTPNDTRDKVNRRQAIGLIEPRVNNELKLLTADDPGVWLGSLGLSPNKITATGKTDSGEKNTVQELHYDTGVGSISGFFKSDIGFNPRPEFHEMKTGIPQHDPNYGARTVAMYRLDQLLKAGVTARAEFAVHQDDKGGSILGTVLETAKGKSGEDINFAMDRQHAQRLGPGAVAMDDPVLLRGLNKLQILDAIAGQLDRHKGNYHISTDDSGGVTGVTGIDLDMSFGSEITSHDHKSTGSAHNYRGLPKAIDAEMGAAILAITPADIYAALTGLLAPAEVNATVERFISVQRAVQDASDAGTLREDWSARGNTEHLGSNDIAFLSNRKSYGDDIAASSLASIKQQVAKALDDIYSGDLTGHHVPPQLLPDFQDLPPVVRTAYDKACRESDGTPLIPALANFIFDRHIPGDMIARFIDAVITELLNQDRFNKAMVRVQEADESDFRAIFTNEITDPAITAIPTIWARMSTAQRKQNRRARISLGRGR